jgi:hypothetical protein
MGCKLAARIVATDKLGSAVADFYEVYPPVSIAGFNGREFFTIFLLRRIFYSEECRLIGAGIIGGEAFADFLLLRTASCPLEIKCVNTRR